jgi:hypothetical protein
MSYSGGNVGIGTATPGGLLQVSGRVRQGSETGTTEPPTINTAGSEFNYSGMVTRRLVTRTFAAGTVVARTGVVRLERDGTGGGFQLVVPKLGPAALAVRGIAVTASGTILAIHAESVNQQATGDTIQVLNDADNVVFCHIMFGNMFNEGDVAEVTLSRSTAFGVNVAESKSWVGTLISSFDQ